MESHIKINKNNNVSDITYMSEPIPSHYRILIGDERSLAAYSIIEGCSGLIRPNNLRSIRSVSCGLII